MSRFKKVLKFVGKPFSWFKRTRRRNKFLVILLLLILAGFIGNKIQEANAKSPYETQKAKYEDIVQVVSETGNINTSGRVDIYSTATGIIEELYVKNGDQIKTGQVLFSIRSTATDQEQAAANATYQQAVSAQKTAEHAKLSADASMWTAQKTRLDANEKKRDMENNRGDYDKWEQDSIDAAKAQAEKNFIAAETMYKEADVAVTAAKAQVVSTSLAYQATKNAKVKATTDGTVANLSLAVGDNVTAGSSGLSGGAGAASTSLSTTTSTSPVLTLANLTSRYYIRVALNEVDIPKVAIGQPVTLILDAFKEKKYKGSITHVDAVGTNTQGVVTYNVLIGIKDPDSSMKPGMTADADIEVDRASRVLTVPNSAIKPYKGGRAVRVVDTQTKELKFIPVTIGIKGETKTQIVSGISEGQEVVTALTNEQVEQQGLF